MGGVKRSFAISGGLYRRGLRQRKSRQAALDFLQIVLLRFRVVTAISTLHPVLFRQCLHLPAMRCEENF